MTTMTWDRRVAVAGAMELGGLNKCPDCCLVPDCPSCGPCDDHDEAREREAVDIWTAPVEPPDPGGF